jgi:hypothetical protein
MQSELFPKFTATWPYLSSGCFGAVHASPCGEWVIKRARNDGTRTYLEWCRYKQSIGAGLRGMPEIDFLVMEDDAHYIVTLRRYESVKDRETGEVRPEVGMGRWYDNVIDAIGCPDYIKELVDAFVAECKHKTFNLDLHANNVMWDKRTKTIIVTDPSSGDYEPNPVQDFELYQLAPEYHEEPKPAPKRRPMLASFAKLMCAAHILKPWVFVQWDDIYRPDRFQIKAPSYIKEGAYVATPTPKILAAHRAAQLLPKRVARWA